MAGHWTPNLRFLDDALLLTNSHAWGWVELPREAGGYGGILSQLSWDVTKVLDGLAKGKDREFHILLSGQRLFLGVCLGRRGKGGPAPRGTWGELMSPAERLASFLTSNAVRRDDYVRDAELAVWRRLANDVVERLRRSALRARPATWGDLAEVVARPLWPGMKKPRFPVEPPHQWGTGSIYDISGGYMVTGRRFIEVTQPDSERGRGGVGCVATLAVARFPNDVVYPQIVGVLSSPLFLGSSPVLSIRVQPIVMKRRQAKPTVEGKPERLSDIEERLTGAASVAERAERENVVWAEMRHKITVVGESPEVASNIATSMIRTFSDFGMDVGWPSGNQLALLGEIVPAGRLAGNSAYQTQRMSVAGSFLAQAMAPLKPPPTSIGGDTPIVPSIIGV